MFMIIYLLKVCLRKIKLFLQSVQATMLIFKQGKFIQEHTKTIKNRLEQQNELLTEIEKLKQIVQDRIEKASKNEGVLTNRNDQYFNDKLPFIYGITPTYQRFTQKADLTRLCQTFLHVKNFHWIIVEDSESKTDLVERFLTRCGVKYTHLAVKTPPSLVRGKNEPRWLKARGVEQRNAGLKWLRSNIDVKETRGVVYFMDDDNTYDLEIFEQVSNINQGELVAHIFSFNLRTELPLTLLTMYFRLFLLILWSCVFSCDVFESEQ